MERDKIYERQPINQKEPSNGIVHQKEVPMLVLTRKLGQEVVFCKDNVVFATLVVAEVERGGKVRFAIDAPQDIQIWRKELWEKMQQKE